VEEIVLTRGRQWDHVETQLDIAAHHNSYF
jgi:hypothetical protein